MDAQKLTFPDATFSHVFLSFGLPIIDDPVAAASDMYRTLKPGGTAITAFWLHNPQGECAIKVDRAIRGSDSRLTIEPHAQHGEKDYIRSLLVRGGFKSEACQLYEHSAFFACARCARACYRYLERHRPAKEWMDQEGR